MIVVLKPDQRDKLSGRIEKHGKHGGGGKHGGHGGDDDDDDD